MANRDEPACLRRGRPRFKTSRRLAVVSSIRRPIPRARVRFLRAYLSHNVNDLVEGSVPGLRRRLLQKRESLSVSLRHVASSQCPGQNLLVFLSLNSAAVSSIELRAGNWLRLARRFRRSSSPSLLPNQPRNRYVRKPQRKTPQGQAGPPRLFLPSPARKNDCG